MKKIVLRILLVVAVAAAAWGGYRLFKQMPQRQAGVPTAPVRQSDVIIRSYTRGELRAVRSVTLTAPNLYGTVQVTRLAPAGALAREKDLIIEFDDSEVLARLEEKQLELEQTEEQIKKSQAELAIRNNQDQVELLQARYSVRRAELEVKRNELLSEIDRKKNELNLQEANRRLKQLESDIKSRLQQAEAELAVLREERNKALVELSREKQRLNQTKLLSPIGGLVSIQQNRFGGMRMFGTQIPDIREGDQVQPGMPVADVLDLSELEIVAKVGELDRANIQEDQDVAIKLDALPDKALSGKIKTMSGTASANVWSGDPSKKFDVLFSVDMRQLLTAVGAKQEQIRKMLEAAARNRNKPVAQASLFRMGGPPADVAFGPQGGGMQAMGGPGGGTGGGPTAGNPDEPQGGEREGRSREGRRRGGGGGFGGSQLSDEDRQKMRAAMQKELGGRQMQDLSNEERQKVMEKIRSQLGLSARSGGRSGERAGTGTPSAGGAQAPPMMTRGGGSAFSEKELAEAKLPPPPEEDDQLEILLRPGLLADVEIIVEKIPNAIHIPSQAVFEKDGRPVVYVKTGGRFEARSVKFSKQSESMMVVSEGLKPGELVALADPEAKAGDRKSDKSGGGTSPMGGAASGGKT